MTAQRNQFVDELPYLSILKTHDLTSRIIELTENILCQDNSVENDGHDENETPGANEEQKENNAKNNNIAMYYIDSIKDFPIDLLLKHIPLTEESQEQVYKRLSVLKVFDLDELLMNVMKTIQFVKSSSFNAAANNNTATNRSTINQIVILINGIDVLWDSYSMHGLKQAKRRLNEIMVRIRSFRNLSSQCTIKTIFTFESIKNDSTRSGNLPSGMAGDLHGSAVSAATNQDTNIMKTVSVGPNSNKKRNIFVLSNYILNFYADASI
ncbi:hypothetical protein ACO0QE_001152 [Hanseniaspora vineae]